MVSIRPQRDKRPPAWLDDFITGGELEQLLAIQPEADTLAVHSSQDGTATVRSIRQR